MAASATTEAPNFPPPMNNNENEPGPAPSTSAVMDRRAATLVQAFNAALDATLKKISYENFAACFPTTAQHKPETLKRFWKDFVDRLGEKCKKQFENILEDRNVVPSLNSLDHLIREALSRKEVAENEASATGASVAQPTPPHTLSPYTLMAAQLGPFLSSQQTALKTTISTLEEQNAALAETVVQQRAEIDTVVRGLEALVGDLEKAAEMVQSEEVRNLTQETKAMREELRDGH